MKKITIFLLLLISISCNKKQSCNDNKKAREIETANIIKTLINSTTENTLPICTNLKKLNVRTDLKIQMKNKDSIAIIKLPPKKDIISQNTEVFIEKLLKTKYNNKTFFDKRDSLNFVEQNYSLNSNLVPKKICEKTKTVSLAKLKSENSNIEYIIISNPIFSSNNKKAYIEIDKYTKIYRHGESLFLEKIGKTWKIIHVAKNWSAC